MAKNFSNSSVPTILLLSHSAVSDSCGSMDCSPPGSSVHGDSPGKNTGVGCHALLQGIFPTKGSNPGLPHCRRILNCLTHQGNPPTILVKFKISLNANLNCISKASHFQINLEAVLSQKTGVML